MNNPLPFGGDWRVIAALGVLICFAIPACEISGAFDSRYGVIVAPFAALSPVSAVIAFIVARRLWQLKRQNEKHK